jgi:tRNA(fMet)-specific endonuclease VapC
VKLYLLDTDHASLLQRGNPHVAARIATLSYHEVAVTTVTAEEHLRGRLRVIRRASTNDELVRGYSGLDTTIGFFKNIRLVGFDHDAARQFAELRRQRIRIGTLDLRIAAVALSVGGVLVTRNRQDFAQVPGLSIENWSR